MERLTKAHYKASDGYYLTCDAMCRREACTSGCNRFGDVIDRLGAYEDAGLSPQACVEAREVEEALSAEDYSIHRMVELMRADKDGRLVVLPRVPDLTLTNKNELYIIDEDEGEIYSDGLYGAEIGVNSMGRVAVNFTTLDFHLFYDEDIGKTVFLTREEAEKALEGRK